MIELDKLPEELVNNRKELECSFIFCIYKEPDLLYQYKNIKNTEDILTEDGIFFYGLANNMIRSGYQVLDHISIYDYTQNKPNLREGFDKRGGYQTIKDITSLLSVKNSDKYYDDLVKSNFLIRLYNQGFPVLKELDKFSDMTSEEIYDYWEYKLANINLDKIEKVRAENLSEGYESYIDKWDKGEDVGFKIGLPMLNYKLLGIHKKNVMLHLSGIGFGKTTSAIAWYILPNIENGNSVLIIANEQDASMWRQMLLSTVMFNYLDTPAVKGLDRHKLLTGNFNDEQKDKMREAAKWLEKQEGKVTFIETNDYSIGSIKKILAKYSKLGIGLCIVDTLKTPNDANERSYAEFIDIAKELFLEAKRLDIAIVATAQLSPDAMSRKFLDLTAIGRAKQISEIADSVVMFRPLTPEERERLKAYEYDGKVKKMIDLDPDKDAIIIFTPKNRYGEVSKQIICERNMAFNSYKQIGWYEASYDTWANNKK